MNTKIILINGKKRSGKDYFASLLKYELETRNKIVEIIAFADPVKEILTTTFGISIDQLDDYKNDDESIIMPDGTNLEFRAILQRFATDAMQKSFGKYVWINKLRDRAFESNSDFIIVPDFRFIKEDISKYNINIINNVITSKDQHVSENELNEFKFAVQIDNTGYKDISDAVTYYADYIT